MLIKRAFWAPLPLLLFMACGSQSPIDQLKAQLNQYPQYSVILEDMKEDGNFIIDYYHRYKVVYAEKPEAEEQNYKSELGNWVKVTRAEFDKYKNYLGMVILSKSAEGQVSDSQYPPGYQYVGDSRYGNWRQDSRGGSFWEFYGKYAFFSHIFGGFGRPIYRSDWNTYRDYRSSGRPYFGRNKEYGTNGSVTKRTNKNFFERRQQRDRARKARFSERVRQRTRRSSMSTFRRRSGGFGK